MLPAGNPIRIHATDPRDHKKIYSRQRVESSEFSIEEITKVEGTASLNVFLEGGKVKKVEFAIFQL